MLTQTFKVKGMTCGGCVNSVKKAVKSVAAVDDVKVTLETGDVEVLYNQENTTSLKVHDAVQKAIENAGYEVVASDKVADTPAPRGGCCCG